MTDFHDPYGQNPFTYDPLGRVPFPEPPAGPPVGPPVFAPPPPPPPRPPVNALATLSLLFAFVFAPVGAVLGHVGLAQIRRTGELGRDRALLGVTLSYTFIALALIALVAWAVLGDSTPVRTAAPTTTTTPAPPPPPAVAPDAVAALLPGADALKNMTGDANLEAGRTWDHPAKSEIGAIDRPECWASIAPGTPDAYSGADLIGYRAAEFTDTRSFLQSVQVIEGAAAFRNPAAAQSQLAQVLTGWRQCGESTVDVAVPDGQSIPFALGPPVDAGNGVTTMDLTPKGLQVRSVRAIAAKANVVVDLYLAYRGTTDGERPRLSAANIANYVLGKIPG